MNKELLKAALEQYQKWANDPMDEDGEGDSTAACTKRAWLRACEWMHEYATREAYELAALQCLKHAAPGLYGPVHLAEEIRALVNSSGKE